MSLNKAKNTKINWLKWVLDFCNTDLGSTNAEKKFYLTYLLEKLFYPSHDPDEIRKRLFEEHVVHPFRFRVITEEIWDNVSSIQFCFKEFFNWIIEDKQIRTLRKEERDDRSQFRGLRTVEANFIPFFAWFSDGSSQSGYLPAIFGKHYIFRHFLGKGELPDSALIGPGNSFVTAHDFSIEVLKERNGSILRDYYLGWLYGILDGVPIQWIHKCNGCGRLFLNPTKRAKIFCKSLCTSRFIMQTKRQELKKDPKAYNDYLRKQREYMQKQYEKKRKAQFGPNVKVGRKPRKRTI
jgi:DNA-directed RNA polymerase subunit RPC12/RpoP